MKNVNSDIAYDFIRRKILNGDYAPGQPLMTRDVSDELGVSRTPIRDALRQLEADGLVVIRPHLGANVKSMNLREYRELCGLRLALESHAAGLAAAHRTESDLESMRFCHEAMRRLTDLMVDAKSEEGLIAELIREDVQFHIAIMTAAKSELVKKEILRLHLINLVLSAHARQSKKPTSRGPGNANRRGVLKSHERILRAIEKGDVSAAKRAMESHIQDIIDKTLRSMERDERSMLGNGLSVEELHYST